MNDTAHVVAVCGSLRDDSTTRTALERALSVARTAGATTDLIDLRHLALPVYDADAGDAGDAGELRRRLRAADAVILGTPVYHGTIASPLKVALDYAGFDEFEDTLVGVLTVAGGSSTAETLAHLRATARALHAWVHPHQVAIPDASDNVEDGRITDASLGERVDTLGEELAESMRGVDAPESIPAAETSSTP